MISSNTEEIYDLHQADSPVLLSIPHSGTQVPTSISQRFTKQALELPDTDWHVDHLYDFAAELNLNVIKANYSRYVIDLNRSSSDQQLYPGKTGTGLVPEVLFDGSQLYQDSSKPDTAEITHRIQQYWKPYHHELKQQLTRLKEIHGFAILYDCHSIAPFVPSLFEGQLPTLNLGTVKGKSCDPELYLQVQQLIRSSQYSHVFDGRFIGGFITREYGKPENNVHAIQMEIAQNSYLSDTQKFTYDSEKALPLRDLLKKLLAMLSQWQQLF